MFNLRDDYYCNDEFDNCGPRRGSSVTSLKHVMNEDWDEDVAGNTKHTSVLMMINLFTFIVLDEFGTNHSNISFLNL